jgi:hypothetical protein
MLYHRFRRDKLHCRRRARDGDLVVLGFGVEAALNAIIDEGDEASGKDDTAFC